MYMYMLTCAFSLPQVKNQIVLWDKIIKREDIASVSMSAIRPEYALNDDGFGLL